MQKRPQGPWEETKNVMGRHSIKKHQRANISRPVFWKLMHLSCSVCCYSLCSLQPALKWPFLPQAPPAWFNHSMHLQLIMLYIVVSLLLSWSPISLSHSHLNFQVFGSFVTFYVASAWVAAWPGFPHVLPWWNGDRGRPWWGLGNMIFLLVILLCFCSPHLLASVLLNLCFH